MSLNLREFEKVKARILAEAEFVDMGDYLKVKTVNTGRDEEICGTIGCIAGHVVLGHYGRAVKIEKQTGQSYYGSALRTYFTFTLKGRDFNTQLEAAKILGLNGEQADILFTDWPSYVDAEEPGTRAYAKAVVRWIDEFIARAEDGEWDSNYGDDDDPEEDLLDDEDDE
jgi:hypothetical protein